LTLQNVAMLQDAFTTLSLKEKCLIRSGVANHSSQLGHFRVGGSGGFGRSSSGSGSLDGSVGGSSGLGLAAAAWAAPGAAAASATDDSGGVESEVASVITDSDRESLDVAMAMMGPDERAELEKEARVLQKNMKAWIMRRNYKAMRDSVRKLQVLWRENKASSSSSSSRRHSSRAQRACCGGSGASNSSASSGGGCSFTTGPGGLGSIDERSAGDACGGGSISSSRGFNPSGSSHSLSGAGGMEEDGDGTTSAGAGNEALGDEDADSDEETAEAGGEGEDEDGLGMCEDRLQEAAGRKLQAGARGMLARRNFRRIKRQTLAMIVIQRTLLRRRNRSSSFADVEAPTQEDHGAVGTAVAAGAAAAAVAASDVPAGLPPLLGNSSALGLSTAGSEALLSFWALESGTFPFRPH
jgi:hypothetical protein